MKKNLNFRYLTLKKSNGYQQLASKGKKLLLCACFLIFSGTLKAQIFQNLYHVVTTSDTLEGGGFEEVTELEGGLIGAIGTSIPINGNKEAIYGIFDAAGTPIQVGKIGFSGVDVLGFSVAPTFDKGMVFTIQAGNICYIVKLNPGPGYTVDWVRKIDNIFARKIITAKTASTSAEIHFLGFQSPSNTVFYSFDNNGTLLHSNSYNYDLFLTNLEEAFDIVYDPSSDKFVILIGILNNPVSIRMVVTNAAGVISSDHEISIPGQDLTAVDMCLSVNKNKYILSGSIGPGNESRPIIMEVDDAGVVQWMYEYESLNFLPICNNSSIVENGAREYVMSFISRDNNGLNTAYLLKVGELGAPISLRTYEGTAYSSDDNRIEDIEYFSSGSTGLVCAGAFMATPGLTGYPASAYWLLHMEHPSDALCFEDHDITYRKLSPINNSVNRNTIVPPLPLPTTLSIRNYPMVPIYQCGFRGNVVIENISGVIELWPNPTQEKLTVEVQGNESVIQEILIFDINGKQMQYQTISKNVNGTEFQLNISNIPDGIYQVVVINADQKVGIKKLQIMH